MQAHIGRHFGSVATNLHPRAVAVASEGVSRTLPRSDSFARIIDECLSRRGLVPVDSSWLHTATSPETGSEGDNGMLLSSKLLHEFNIFAQLLDVLFQL